MTKERGYTRRDFLRGSAYGAAALALGVPFARVVRGEEQEKAKLTKVVLVRDFDALDKEGACNGPVVARMLDDAVTALTGLDEPAAAWKSLLSAEDILGIKSNVIHYHPTPPAIDEAIRTRALAAGIAEERISVGDRGVLKDPVFQRATALINVRPLRTHHWSGIGGCIKNYIMFVSEPWKWHDDSCADLGGLWKLPITKDKTRLNVLVLLTPLFYGVGPHHFDPEYVWPYKGLLVGTDPVALDALGVTLLAEKRKRFFERPPRGGTSTKHVQLADTRHGVGTADLEKIELIRLGPMEDALI
jgi:hypothetical protein